MALQDKLIDALGRFATTFNSYRYIMAIKSAFITLMPVIIVGAFSVLISNMVLDPKNGLASFQSLSFLAALKPITSAINYATLNFLNIGAVFLIGIELGRINGIKSLFANGCTDFTRFRVGIGRPLPHHDVVDHVLTPFPEELREAYQQGIEDAATAIEGCLSLGVDKGMNRYNPKKKK